jgi:hypothetical protein
MSVRFSSASANYTCPYSRFQAFTSVQLMSSLFRDVTELALIVFFYRRFETSNLLRHNMSSSSNKIPIFVENVYLSFYPPREELMIFYRVCSEGRCALRLRNVDLVVYRSCRWSVLLFHCIQLLNSGWSAMQVKCFNWLIQVLLNIILSIDKCIFLVEYVFREGNRHTELVQQQFA